MTIRSPVSQYVCFVVLVLTVLVPSCKRRTTAEFISIKDPEIALKHIRVIDGTGKGTSEDQTIIIESGHIAAIGPTAQIPVPAAATSLDLSGHTAMPGLVGMHHHLFYATDGGDRYVNAPESFAPLYLAAGVTTIRTAGALDLDTDQAVKRSVDRGRLAGPKIHLSSPYINRRPGDTVNPQKVANIINGWADQGITSLKIYENEIRSNCRRGTQARTEGYRTSMRSGFYRSCAGRHRQSRTRTSS